MLRNHRTMPASPLILSSEGQKAPRGTWSSQDPGSHLLPWVFIGETVVLQVSAYRHTETELSQSLWLF